MNSVTKGEQGDLLNSESQSNEELIAPTDEQLLCQFLNGSNAGYELLVQRYKQRVFEFIYFQIKQHKHDAEDLTQEVFLELFKKASNFRRQSKFSTYLFSIARNVVLNHFRASSRRLSLSQIFKKERSKERLVNLQEQFIQQINQQNIVRALNTLSVDERQIIYLCDKENFSYMQISQILNIKLGTVRSRLNTAKSNLAQIYRETNDEM